MKVFVIVGDWIPFSPKEDFPSFHMVLLTYIIVVVLREVKCKELDRQREREKKERREGGRGDPMEQEHVVVVGEEYCSSEEKRELTVRKTSLFSSGDGFEAYDHSSGDIVFRVDNYDGRHSGGPSLAEQQIVLMDPTGASILTLRKKWPTLHQRWEGFLGERVEGQKPLFSVKWSSIFGGGVVEVELLGATANSSRSNIEYRVEGCFAQRCCRIVMIHHSISEEDDVVVGDPGDCNDVDDDRAASAVLLGAEIKRKVDPCANIVLGKDVFSLCIKPGFDAAFAMGLVLVLDQINGSDGDSDHDNDTTTDTVPSSKQPNNYVY